MPLDDLLRDAAMADPASLPLLEFALDQLFYHRRDHRLTRYAYQEIGGVRGALSKHAESTYEALPSEEHRRLARTLFVRLVQPTGGLYFGGSSPAGYVASRHRCRSRKRRARRTTVSSHGAHRRSDPRRAYSSTDSKGAFSIRAATEEEVRRGVSLP